MIGLHWRIRKMRRKGLVRMRRKMKKLMLNQTEKQSTKSLSCFSAVQSILLKQRKKTLQTHVSSRPRVKYMISVLHAKLKLLKL